ncbi:MAG TPA: hypothetical protein VEU29_01925 [Actinomycetota bacterium]|nr:hypothetical protein [Actinomycetota bacterium]
MRMRTWSRGRFGYPAVGLVVLLLASLTAGPLADPATAGGASLSVLRWDVDYATGNVSYDLALDVTGAAAVGAPCEAYCSWRIELWYRDGTTELSRGSVAGGSESSANDLSIRRTATTVLPEATHLRAVVEPKYNAAGAKYVTGWHEVSTPFPTGTVWLEVGKWFRDPASGSAEYDVTLSWAGAAQLNGPCVSYCRWRIEIWYQDGTTDEWRGGLGGATVYAQNTWSTKVSVARTEQLPSVTHLRAVLTPAGRVPGETYEYWRFVGDHMVDDRDVVPYEIALAAPLAAAASDRFCDVLAVAGGALPSVEPDSPPDAWKRCVEAVRLYGPNIRKVLAAVATAAGGSLAIDYLLDEHVDEGPTPTPEEEANPPLPWVPPDTWEDNGCERTIPPESVEAVADHVESRHAWGSEEPGSKFYPRVDWRYLATVDALRVPPSPSSKPEWADFRCERVVEFHRHVGVDQVTGKPTRTYTVVTRRSDGSLVTTHPGEPKR